MQHFYRITKAKRLLFILLLIPAFAMAQAPVAPPSKHAKSPVNKPQRTEITQELRKYIATLNSSCPQKNVMGYIKSYTILGNEVIVTIICDEDIMSLDRLNSNRNLLKENLLTSYRNSSDLKPFVVALAQSHVGLTHKYVGESSGKKCIVKITQKELADAASVANSEKDPMKILEAFVLSDNSNCPYSIEDGMIFLGWVIEEFYVVYEVKMDEEMYSIEQLIQNSVDQKDRIIQSLDVTDATTNYIMKLLIQAKKGLAYRYIGDTTFQKSEVKISLIELRNLISEE